ncbi:hypothetical protein SAMN05421664_3514 [Chryseobacterium soldanellicola]|uniref:C1q domain-containing protein n=1 Tax=Chryseobacterium soldanellicola TaxID=311333 RepID=A0A1H1G8P4_9FLAO|nr:hypothetical protein [Chryseobacterium soldanellicola]SDR09455.1 hypothetical protein SAMN05421664_3514 [Chryseobacterium soldanellicola]
MKKYLYSLILFSGLFTFYSGQIGIGTAVNSDGVMLQLESSNKGLLFPRVALVSRTATTPLLPTIPTGTIVFNTSTTGSFPNLISPGIYWWSAEDQQWTNMSTNLETAAMKYTNSEITTNYNTTTLQNVKLFGNLVYNESSSIYSVNTTNQTLTIKKQGLYSISSILSFDRLSGGDNSMVSLSARLFINGNPVGTEQVFSPEETASVNSDRGLFSYAFTEYLPLNTNDIISIKIKKTAGTYSSGYGDAEVKFHQSGDSSIALLRIR